MLLGLITCSQVRARVHASEFMRNQLSTQVVIKHMSFNRVHVKKAIHLRFGAREHQVGIELYRSFWSLITIYNAAASASHFFTARLDLIFIATYHVASC